MQKRVLGIISVLAICSSFTQQGLVFATENSIEKEILKPAGEIIAEEENTQAENSPVLPSIFIWQLPEEQLIPEIPESYDEGYEEFGDNEVDVADIDTTTDTAREGTVKGYLEYLDDANSITLKKPDKDFVLNLSKPQKFEETGLLSSEKILPATSLERTLYSRSDKLQYNIAPIDTASIYKDGGFSLGTTYNESIDTSDLGFTTSFFTKYETNYFSLKSSFDKDSGVAYSDNIDKLVFTPELKLTKHLSIKDVFTSDITRNKKKNEIILSIKPRKDDRVRFEFGAGQTFDNKNELIRSQVKFSTQFRW